MEARESKESVPNNEVEADHKTCLESDKRIDQHEDSSDSDGYGSSSATKLSIAGGGRGDINAAAALRAQYAIDVSDKSRGGRRRRQKKSVATTSTASLTSSSSPKPVSNHQQDNLRTATEARNEEGDDEPLVDTTVALPLHSKKTSRLQRKQERRSAQALLRSQSLGPTRANLLTLPTELLFLILSHLRPSDIPKLHLVCNSLHAYLTSPTTTSLLSTSIIQSRYWVLSRCFPLPIPFHELDTTSQSALLLPKRLDLMSLHRKSYRQHILPIDPEEVCTCMTCVFAWNNLCLILDLNHWQKNLDQREPIPMIKRGRNPEWNAKLLDRNAEIVRLAIKNPLVYAWILELHLNTTTSTILRNSRWESKRKSYKKINPPPSFPCSGTSSSSTRHQSSSNTNDDDDDDDNNNNNNKPPPSSSPPPVLHPQRKSNHHTRTYELTDQDADQETDEFLERKGPASYDFPFHRDNYYDIEVYLPNRKWNPSARRWGYYATPPAQHEKDLEWVRGWSVRARELRRGILSSGRREEG